MEERALRLFEEMRRQGLQQDEITHMVVIAACGKRRRVDKSLQLFEEVLPQG